MNSEPQDATGHGGELPVYIRYGRRPFLGSHARDVSAGGMFLSVQSLTLPVGTPVELELSCLGRGWLIPAVVVRGDNAGICVKFCEPQPELVRGMSAALDMPPPMSTVLAEAARPGC
jgi:hypothetical protein